MIQEACTYVDAAPDSEKRVKLIETLRTVTEGKVTLLRRYGEMLRVVKGRTMVCLL